MEHALLPYVAGAQGGAVQRQARGLGQRIEEPRGGSARADGGEVAGCSARALYAVLLTSAMRSTFRFAKTKGAEVKSLVKKCTRLAKKKKLKDSESEMVCAALCLAGVTVTASCCVVASVTRGGGEQPG